MTSAQVQSLLTTLYNHIDGKAGEIDVIAIKAGAARVTLDWAAFVDNFAGMTASAVAGSDSTRWTKTVGAITYEAVQPGAGSSSTVPSS